MPVDPIESVALDDRLADAYFTVIFGALERISSVQPFGDGCTIASPAVYTREGGDRRPR